VRLLGRRDCTHGQRIRVPVEVHRLRPLAARAPRIVRVVHIGDGRVLCDTDRPDRSGDATGWRRLDVLLAIRARTDNDEVEADGNDVDELKSIGQHQSGQA
jgi:hypothetical protein